MDLKQEVKKTIMKCTSIILGNKNVFTYNMPFLGRKREEYVITVGDYVRVSSLELVAEEIYRNKLYGNVAELGVFQGDFAKKINIAFPDRRLYLFDTFEGFDERDKKNDIERGYSTAKHDLSGTSVDLVMKKMRYKDNCIIKKGFFPESAENIDDSFVFVSIDTDLFDPIYAGLCWFYPKMCRGGVIFVHDYNNKGYAGSKEAVLKFCKEKDLFFFPLSDIAGSAVIIKN